MKSGQLCECGCGEQTNLATRTQRGYKRGDPVRFAPGHANQKLVEYREEDRGFESPCWIWTKNLDVRGYPAKWDGQKRRLVKGHRVYYEREHGVIPEGMLVHHRCEQKACVNPAHLQALTRSEHGKVHSPGPEVWRAAVRVRRERARNRTEKVCQDCQRLLPMDAFGVKSRKADGRDSYCRPCAAAQVKRRREKYGRTDRPKRVSA